MRFSTSFSQADQLRVEHLDYEVWVEEKAGFKYLADTMYIGIQEILFTGPAPFIFRPTTAGGGNLVGVGTCTLPKKVTSGTLSKVDISSNPGIQWENHDDRVWVFIDVPVFKGYYNPGTDVLGCVMDWTLVGGVWTTATPKKPNGTCTPTVVLDPTLHPDRYDPGGTLGIVLGADIKIQVVKIYQ